MSTHLLYLGPLRPETVSLLEPLSSTEQALFVMPSESSEQWKEVQTAFPNATQQVMRVAETSGEKPYYEFNLPEFNASQPATGLYQLYPGLELIESNPQPLVSVEKLLSELENPHVNTLVVEQPELVWPLLQALAALPISKQINRIWFRLGSVPLYQGMPAAKEILSWCQEQGFELKATHDEDPDLPLLQLSRHPFYNRWQDEAEHSAALAEQLKAAQAAIETSQAEHQTLSAQHEQLQQRYEALQAQQAEQAAQQTALQEKLAEQQALQITMEQLHKDINKKFEEQHGFIKDAANALGQHITRRTAD
ncbi:hypothetical protein HaloA020_35690 [Halomonas sp. A020]|uniref:hypothetical protein n=1 Tax=Halomonas sp. A020 TaxID=2717374 RepID=UPI0024932B07|nr:hypothetical protein [Halomonas sp. A020]BCB62868.1 hypothetical protein HaloA020_35690 [Halomonas sp. A020]